MNSKIVFFFMIMCCCSVTLFAQTNTGKKQTSTNPVFDGWYADCLLYTSDAADE